MVQLNPAYTALIHASQQGLAIEAQPYLKLAQELGVSEAYVMKQFQTMLDQGLIRRIAAIPNHYALGYVANGMCVWNITDDSLEAVGTWLGAQAGVSHCYRRPRRLPEWPYNLFAMLHGRDHDTVRAQAQNISLQISQRFPGVLHDLVGFHPALFDDRLAFGGDLVAPRGELDRGVHRDPVGELIGFPEERWLQVKQVHGSDVALVTDPPLLLALAGARRSHPVSP